MYIHMATIEQFLRETVPLRLLKPGAIFRTCGIEYRLIYHNDCRAYVQDLRKRHNVIENQDGTKNEFDAPGGKINISPNTVVEPVAESESATVGKNAPPRRGGKPAGIPIKQCKRGTKRAAVLEKLLEDLTGTTSVKKACEELKMSRSLLLTHAFEIHRDHGMGYAVDGDSLTVSFLAGVDPFAPVVKDSADDLI